MKKPNRLINETSPYLLQHAYNPVNWFPWGEEAFETAAKENKPVFISIGYSACHWCHVMGEESFADDETAVVLNDNFICIKVDREEFPDVDNYYMEACRIMTGGGGWPLSVFALPDKKPFLAGTYFPKSPRRGQMSFVEILNKITELWKTRYEAVLHNTDEIQRIISQNSQFRSSSSFNEKIFSDAFNYFKSAFDSENGGFGSFPKFPSPHNLLFLLRYRHHFNDDTALEMVEKTVTNICSGGIFDQAGFGFHRYSTDAKWLVPHFEKMLYDQAMMILVLTDLYKITRSSFYLYYLEKTIDFTLQEFTSPDNAFYSAQDADSEGIEGKYYLWNYDELTDFLNEDELLFLNKYFNITRDGNYCGVNNEHHSGLNILNFNPAHLPEFDEAILRFEPIREKIIARRNKRIPPLLDNKVLTDWNGLMIYSLSYAAFTLSNESYMKSALTAYDFIMENHFEPGRLYHFSAANVRGVNSILDDYAFMGIASLNLFQFTGKINYLKNAMKLSSIMISGFFDKEKILFRHSDSFFPDESLNLSDNAYPSGNSAAFLFLSRLTHLTKIEGYINHLLPFLDHIPEIIAKRPQNFTFLLQALFDLNFNFSEAIFLKPESYSQSSFLAPLKGLYEPDKAFLVIDTVNFSELAVINDFFNTLIPQFSQPPSTPILFICDKNGCSLPVAITEEIT